MNDWQDAEQRVEKAQELFEQRRWHEALEELRAAIAINPYNSGWSFNIGLTLDELERYEEAIEAYRATLDIEPDDLQALAHLGIDLHRTGQFEKALRTFERMESIDPSHEPSYCHRIITYSELNDHEKAEEMFYLARLYTEHCPHCYYNIGCSLSDRGLYDKAIYCWHKTLDLDESHPDVQLRIAEALWSKGELEGARQHYLLSLRQEPGDIHTLLDLGELLTEMGRIDEAGEKFRRAIELAPEQPAGYFWHANWLARAGRYAEAVAMFEKTLRLDPSYPGAHLRLGELSFRTHDVSATRRHVRAELALRSQDPQVLLQLSNLLLDTGYGRMAIACLRRLISVDAANVSAWQNLAVAQFTVGRYVEGIGSCHEALRHDPENLMAIYNLASAHEHIRQYGEAMKWVKRGLSINPNDTPLQKLELRIRVLRFRDRMINLVRGVMFPVATRRHGNSQQPSKP